MTSYYARTQHRRPSRSTSWSMSADGLMDMARRKPEALLLIGAGVALMMRNSRGFTSSFGARSSSSDWREQRREFARQSRGGRGSYQPTGEDGSAWSQETSEGMLSSARETMRDARQSAAQMASETGESMTRHASDLMRRVGDTASSYASSASRWAGDARSGLMDRSHRLTERARTLPEELDEAVQDHPLVLAALGVAIGAALGATLPSTSIENRAMGEASDQLWEAAESASGRLGEAAEEAYDEAWRSAESRGLSKEGLADMARDVGTKFASAATGDSAQEPSHSGASSSGALSSRPSSSGMSSGAAPGSMSGASPSNPSLSGGTSPGVKRGNS